MHVRKARVQDAEKIHALIESLSHDGTLLPRSFGEICENIRDFQIAQSFTGEFLGCGALHIYGPHLAEVRSIVVHPASHRSGTGGKLLDGLIAEAEDHGIQCVCLFTRIPEFFARYGFEVADRARIPDKIHKDCLNCPRLHACDEIAMARGELPVTPILAPEEVRELVQLVS